MIYRGRNLGTFLQQGVTLVGLETLTFNDALDAIIKIYGIFSQTLPEGSLKPGDFINHEKNNTLHVLNRLLTSKKDVVNMKVLMPVNGVNPCGILKVIIDEGEYQHCDNNEVKYILQMQNRQRQTER